MKLLKNNSVTNMMNNNNNNNNNNDALIYGSIFDIPLAHCFQVLIGA